MGRVRKMKSWKQMVVVFFLLSLIGSPCTAAWHEKIVVPAEYEKMDYNSSGHFFWLFRKAKELPRDYYQLEDQLRSLPEQFERGRDYLNPIPVDKVGEDRRRDYLKELLILVQERGKAEKKGLVDLEGNVVVPTLGNEEPVSYYEDGFYDTTKGIGKDGVIVFPESDGREISRVNGTGPLVGLFQYNQSYQLLNGKREVAWEITYSDEIQLMWGELVYGKSNGTDGNPQEYRIWNSKSEDITPYKEGFEGIVVLNSPFERVNKQSLYRRGILGETKDGWFFYPYEKGKFGASIPIEGIALKSFQVIFAIQQSPNRYMILADKQITLNMVERKMYSYYDPDISVINKGRNFFTYLLEGEKERVRISDLNKKVIFEIVGDKSAMGEEVFYLRDGKVSRIFNYEGKVEREFSSFQERYIPSLWRDSVPDGAGEKLAGALRQKWGKYQPFYSSGIWGIMNRDTGKDVVEPDSRYGSIIIVSEDGKRFWSLFGEGEGTERRYGLKQFDLVQ